MTWLNERRVRVYPRIAVVLALAIWIISIVGGDGLRDINGYPIGYDFVTFWSASDLALDGRAAEAYDPPKLYQAEQDAVDAKRGPHLWSYPPSFYVFVAPLAVLPYVPAYLFWLVLTGLPYLLVARRVAPVPGIVWLAAASGGFIQSVGQGQTGVLMAAILGLGLLLLPRRPVLGGAVLGLLVCKPQLALLIPVAVLAGRHWRSIVPGVLTASGTVVLSVAVLGVDTWRAFFDSADLPLRFLEEGFWKYSKMPTVEASALLAGLPVDAARLLQVVSTLAVLALVGWLWTRPVSYRVKCAGLLFAALLATPYAYDYDYAVTGFGLAFLGMEAYENGWLRWEKEALFMGYLLPYLFGPIALVTNFQVAPLGIAILLAMAVRRARVQEAVREERSQALSASPATAG